MMLPKPKREDYPITEWGELDYMTALFNYNKARAELAIAALETISRRDGIMGAAEANRALTALKENE